MRALLRWIGLCVIAFMALQLFFVARIALMLVVHPGSTTFQRSAAWQMAREHGELRWRQQWVPDAQISDNL
mgnify:CR=1 FL=1